MDNLCYLSLVKQKIDSPLDHAYTLTNFHKLNLRPFGGRPCAGLGSLDRRSAPSWAAQTRGGVEHQGTGGVP